MSKSETYESLEKEEKDLEAEINAKKEELQILDKKTKAIQGICEQLQSQRAELQDRLTELNDNHQKKMKDIKDQFNKKIKDLDTLISNYSNPLNKVKFKCDMIHERRRFLAERWKQKETSYIVTLNQLKEQLNQTRAKLSALTMYRMQRQDNPFRTPLPSEDPLEVFLANDSIRSMNFGASPEPDWANAFINSSFEKKFDIDEKENQIKTLENSCRVLNRRKLELSKLLKDKSN